MEVSVSQRYRGKIEGRPFQVWMEKGLLHVKETGGEEAFMIPLAHIQGVHIDPPGVQLLFAGEAADSITMEKAGAFAMELQRELEGLAAKR